VYYDIDVIEQYPSGLVVSGSAETLQAVLAGLFADFIGNRPHLPIAGTGGDDKIVGCGRLAVQVQDHNVGAVAIASQLRGFNCKGLRVFVRVLSQNLFLLSNK
jgi:hypothetical protein